MTAGTLPRLSRQPSRASPIRESPLLEPERPASWYSGSTTLPTALRRYFARHSPTALARVSCPRRSTVTSNSSHHAVQLRVTLDRGSVLEPSSPYGPRPPRTLLTTAPES